MKKLISLLLVTAVLGLNAKADTFVANTAKNQRGESVSSDYAGYDSTRIAGTAEIVVCTGRCLLAGIIQSTGIAAGLAYFYDSSVAGSSAIGRLKLTNAFYPADSGPAQPRIPRPIRFNDGITVKMNTVAAGESMTVLFVDLDAR